MIRALLRRLLIVLPVIWGVTTIVFLLIHLIPGDPIEIMLGSQSIGAQRQELRQQLGLDQPLGHQYVNYWAGVLKGDLGVSIASGEPVMDRILARYPATLQLALVSMVVALLIALPLGILAAARRNSWLDHGSMVLALAGVSMPNFWLGPLLILFFAFHYELFPIGGREGWSSIVLPAITLGTALAAILSRMTRSSLLEVVHQEYIRVARAKGLSPFRIYTKHALRNALLPVVTIMGLQFGALLAGAIITEEIFSWPGLGLEIVEAIRRRDYPVVQGCILVISLSYVVVNLVTDFAYTLIDPRMRMRQST